MILPLDKHHLSKVKKHPLFNSLSLNELEQLLVNCKLIRYSNNDLILQKKSSREGLLLLLDGMVEIFVNGTSMTQEEVLDILQKGDLIGLSSLADFLGEPTHQLEFHVSVRAIEETVCLSIPFAVLEILWQKENVRDYILRQVAVRLKDVYSSLAEQLHLANQFGESDTFIRRIQDIMTSPAVTVNHDTPIQEVAKYMLSKPISSVIILKESTLVGIITERDLVNRLILTEDTHQQKQVPVSNFMTSNPFTISRSAYYYEALSIFLTNRIKHLPVLDGDKVVGIVTLSDLMRKRNRGLLESLQSIEEASFDTLPEVKQAIYFVLSTLLKDGIPITQTLEVITKLYDRLVKRCINLSLELLNLQGEIKPDVHFCWFQMGSAGRKEQFILTDQDHFLVYENIDHLNDEEQSHIKKYFTLLTHEVVRHLQQAGFVQCKGEMMASNIEWRGSLNTWATRLRRWRLRSTNDNLLLAQNFFSFRFLYGQETLHQQFLELVREELCHARVFLYRLACLEMENSVPILEQPIRSLFRLDRKSIDLKKEALFPLHHSLQILSMGHGIIQGTPLERIKYLVEKHAFSTKFADDLLFAYTCIMKIRVEQGWSLYQHQEKNTSVLPLNHLKSNQKAELIQALKTVRSLQSQVFGSFNL